MHPKVYTTRMKFSFSVQKWVGYNSFKNDVPIASKKIFIVSILLRTCLFSGGGDTELL